MKKLLSTLLVAAALVGSTYHTPAQIITKVADLNAGTAGNGYGPNNPETSFTLIGSNLWFTATTGGLAVLGEFFTLILPVAMLLQLLPSTELRAIIPWAPLRLWAIKAGLRLLRVLLAARAHWCGSI